MTVTINGTTGIDKVAPGAVETADLPAGTVLQVVQASTKTNTASASSSYVDVSGLSASITPTSATSKILVNVGLNGLTPNTGVNAAEAWFQLTDGSGTLIAGIFNGFVAQSNQTYGLSSVTYALLHSPATTSSITYKIQGKGASNGFQVNNYYSTASYTGSFITLMEIAA